MNNPEQESGAESKDPSQGTSMGNVQNRLNQAYSDYIRALQAMGEDSQQRFTEVHLTYVQALQRTQMSTLEHSLEVYRSYLIALHQAGRQANPQQHYAEAYSHSMRTLQERLVDFQN